MVYDCFFSYQNKDLYFVEGVVHALEQKGITCWYAPRNVVGRYAKAIAEGINHSSLFVLVLNARSAVSEAVLNEVEMAQNVYKQNGNAMIQPLCTETLDLDSIELQEMMYYIRRLQFINVENIEEYELVAEKLMRVHPQLLKKSQERNKSGYIVQKIEDERLKIQNEILKSFDDDVYKNIFTSYKNPRILDVGCGTGDMLMPYVLQFDASCFIGVDRSEKQILNANEKYGNEKSYFFVQDVMEETFEEKLVLQMHRSSIEKFDIINISMLLLHLKEPVQLLTVIKKYLHEDGTLIIRDIDDGLNFAYPDKENAFERIYKMCEHDEQSGSRKNGRQVYHDLIKAGFKKVKIEKQGLSSAGMHKEQKEALFRMYFPFTLENAKIMMDKYPWNLEYKEDYLWYKEKYDEIHKQFLKEDFIFSLGFISYSAKL